MVIFDLDGVLVDIDSSWELIHRAFGTENEKNFQRYLRGEIDYRQFMRTDIEKWGRVHIEELKKILDEVPLMPTALSIINELKKMGYKTAIISSGLSILADRIKKMLRIDYAYANELLVDKHGWLTGEGGAVVELSRKDLILERLAEREGIKTQQCVAIGDSNFDISLFNKVGLSIAFNAKDKIVQNAADIVIENKDLRQILPWITSKKLIKASFSLKFKNSRAATAILNSVSPDNSTTPLGLSVRGWKEGKTVYIKILSAKETATMLATINDLFACMQAAEDTIKVMGSFVSKTI